MSDSPVIDGLFGAAAPASVVDVLLPLALDKAYSYRVPAGLSLASGDLVTVPLGTRETIGVVWDRDPGAPAGSGGNLKAVSARHDWPPLSPHLRRFVDWIAAYTLAPKGMVARMAIRDPESAGPEKPRYGVRLTGNHPAKLTDARSRVILAAQGGFAFPKSDLARLAGVSTGVIDALVDAEVMEAVPLPPEAVAPSPDAGFAVTELNDGQAAAAESLGHAVRERRFSVTLLEGITGSGKTEVYFEAVADALRAGRQVMILMPEIALTAQFLARFEKRFGVRPAEWHSGVASNRKDRLWRAIAAGEAKVIVGARSALFLPFAALGLIIVDEEHEQAYKQEDGVHYHARDMAVVRGRIEGCPVVLASATPSVESRVNAESGRYQHIRLPERFGGRKLPQLSAIDLKAHPTRPGSWISQPLKEAVAAALAAGDQALLFLNRRGYAPLTLCRHCGHRWQCPDCSAWLVEHRFRRSLVCHHCGHIERTPQRCEACGAENSLTVCGPGVERLAEEAAVTFPGVRAIVLSSDFPGGTERLRRELDAVAAGEFQLIIGTQLVAKGHNFPGLALVGVIDADVGLTSGDPRAAERTFQLLQQVTGRAGRGDVAGRGLVQTHDPDHPVIKAILSGDAERFYAEEIAMRRAARLPPFGRLAGIVISGPDKAEAEAHARALAQTGLQLLDRPEQAEARWEGLSLLGPAEAPIALIRGRHRLRLLARGPRDADLQGFLRSMLANGPKERRGIRVGIDIDPMSFI
ncbi:MAG: primosomal protein N' [Methylocystis sp.]|nr:primosomal protein N' [Methylocystis sp.]MCA3584357.1 primosomal protein N' [Methylocystis sp.]MCA3589372.1 primosomal protein N' [Methylocystis sp.]MCA3592622.1 primosomal protein N' [Methylocystis sp.]